MKLLLTFFIVITFHTYSSGTQQHPDELIYKGKKYDLDNYLLEFYFTTHPEKKPASEVHSTGLYRGYVATFEIIDQKLYLIDVKILKKDTKVRNKFINKWRSVMSEVFPKQRKVLVDWFDGLLILTKGEPFAYDDHVVWKDNLVVELHGQDVVNVKQLDQKQFESFKEEQFEKFRSTDEYKTLLVKLGEEKKLPPDSTERYIKDRIIGYLKRVL